MSTILARDGVKGGARPLIAQYSTNDVAARLRTDYWMAHAFKAVEARIRSDDPYWQGTVCTGARGQFVHSVQSGVDTMITRRRLQAALSDEHIAVCLIHDGAYEVEQSDGQQFRFGAGQLFMFDCGQPMRAHWGGADISYLRLPRTLVLERLGRDPRALGRIALSLDDARLKPFLCAQMTLLGRDGPTLAPDELGGMLDATIDIACFLLQLAFPSAAHHAENTGGARLLAARRYIEENLHRYDLTPQHVAQALNCSRAQLYRLFEAQSMSVGETIREARLQRSLRYLQDADAHTNIGEIAGRCGIPDQSAFGKQFRQRFGMTPGEARRCRSNLDEIVHDAA